MIVQARARLGFFDGIGAFFGGMGFVVFRPALWGWAMIPVAIATALFLVLGALSIWASSGLVNILLSGAEPSAWANAGGWALRIVLWLVGLVVSFLLAMSLAQPLSGFALDTIARRQESALGNAAWPDQPALASALRSLRVSLSALAVSLPAVAVLTLVTFVFPPASIVTIPLKFLVAGLAAAYDLLDYPLGLRGMGVRDRLAFMRWHLPAFVGFGVAAGACLLVPGAALFVLPFGVAGGARLVVAADRTNSLAKR